MQVPVIFFEKTFVTLHAAFRWCHAVLRRNTFPTGSRIICKERSCSAKGRYCRSLPENSFCGKNGWVALRLMVGC